MYIMTWAQKRKLYYIIGIVIFLLIFVVLPIIILTYKAPTCFDAKQNQDEQGIDCGGVCTLLCESQPASLNVLWYRFSKVNDGIYNVLAYVENPNTDAEATTVNYSFRLYDQAGVLLKERNGQTFVPAGTKVAIFQPEMLTGSLVPNRLDFVFSSSPIWLKQKMVDTGLSSSQIFISQEDTAPRLTFTLTNDTIKQIKDIEAVAIIYNAEGNTIAFSRTIIDAVNGRGSQLVNFNWPRPFSEAYSRSEILLKILK
jgi:hypothetical protein